MNRWNLPEWMEQQIIARDQRCVYCGVEFSSTHQSRKNKPTWEHIINDARLVTLENIASCCSACNASKGAKELRVWLESPYCKKLGITKDSVATIIKQSLANSIGP
ncbi:MAG: hypothetical protein KF804_06020 [Burkholderiales bacterium]|nr:hypothetical protein [Burkholderiales bacterium]